MRYLLNNCRNKNILELESGKFDNVIEFTESGGKMAGIDISKMFINSWKQYSKNINFTDILRFNTVNSEALNFSANTFDIVFGQADLNHIDVDRSIKDISNVLTHNGLTLFIELTGNDP